MLFKFPKDKPFILLLFSLIALLIAFVLSSLCVFAGSKRGFLENGDLLTASLAPKFLEIPGTLTLSELA